ncbi:MAG: sigma-70 family RNA polymerase sigma factor [Clostridia bacterium]|nr:sigma-70 family RNA polymerase sigma factor [Clostridia bacterium]
MEHAAVPSMVREQRLREWIARYSGDVMKLCYVYLSDRGQAEDATQDTFLKAWRHMNDFERRGIGNEKAWLMRIAINTCKDYKRTGWFRHVDTRQSIDSMPPARAEDTADHDLAMDVRRLSDKFKQVVLLYYYQGMTIQETAKALGIPASTVHRRLKQAVALLKDSLMGGDTYEG